MSNEISKRDKKKINQGIKKHVIHSTRKTAGSEVDVTVPNHIDTAEG